MASELLDVADAGQVEAAGRTLATLHQVLWTYPGTVAGGPTGPKAQLVHGDYRSANVLADGTRVTAILDFDEVTYRSRVVDLGRAAVLLATRYLHWRPTDAGTRDLFVAAYSDIAPLEDAERAELRGTICAVLAHFGWT